MIIALSGFMGCGKSTAGRMLAERLPDFDFTDLDDFIEEDAGMSISQIFANGGEKAFREIESDALECLLMVSSASGRDMILALGGGTLTNRDNAALVREHCENFYLKAELDTLCANLEGASAGRPMLGDGEGLRTRIESLMKKRASVYEKAADHVIVTDGRTMDEIVSEIIGKAGL